MFEENSFNPALSIPEASARIFGLTGTPAPGTRGPKRALVALAESLGVPVDLAEVNASLGARVADRLNAEWREGRDFVELQVTLDGMNALLHATSMKLAELSNRGEVPSESVRDVFQAFPTFSPATNKQQAVDRLCDLAGVERDRLGPGGKEHMSTLLAIARRFAPEVADQGLNKHDLAASLCGNMDVPWIAAAGSTGGSITLDGLNLLLAGVERRANRQSRGWLTAEEEGRALVAALSDELDAHWDGRLAIMEMRESGSTQWRQMEWAGFYFEEKVREILNLHYPTPAAGGPRVRFGSTVFDYASSNRVWDAKAHTVMRVELPGGTPFRLARDRYAWLNDVKAMRDCVALQGLGFLIVEGLSILDATGEFRDWHKSLSSTGPRPTREYVASTGISRLRKAAFTPLQLRAVWLENSHELEAAILGGWLIPSPQPNWAGTVARKDKFKGDFDKAGPWEVAHFEWPG